MRRWAVVMIAGGLLAAGCGDDGSDGAADDRDPTTTTAPEVTPEPAPVPSIAEASATAAPFCQAAVEIAVASGSTALRDNPSPETLDRLRAAVRGANDVAPAELSGTIESLGLAVGNAAGAESDLGTGVSPAAFTSDAAIAAEWLSDNCGFARLELDVEDGRITGVPDSMTEGGTILTVHNGGSADQIVLVARVAEDADDPVDDLVRLPDDELVTKLAAAGVAGAGAGQDGPGLVALTSGRYAVWAVDPNSRDETGAVEFTVP